MGSEYDLKFEEMKKYIPFLDGMIRRLETNGKKTGNPRQAQLEKIQSLRELLSIKKKRMKMENLHKCEQVLVNLYAKVESQKIGSDPGFSIDPPTPQEKSDLEAVRNKLKTMAKRQEDEETLPEILRVDEVEEIHTAGSKEPALFQRRPNKSSVSPTHSSPIKIKEDTVSPQSSASKRNYTRVLVSPDSSRRRWSTSDSAEEKPLFSRRSPRRSPRRSSPSYHKKERKKSLKASTRKSKGVNITLNVPENSLSSLNTKDIFSRIINCKDGDVDIDTLRELRKQILGELKKTGSRDDISDLILKSYNKKKERFRRKEEVEEGELSDSESEVIENVYGSLSGNLVLKDDSDAKTSTNKEKNRKIQICLVINSNDNDINKSAKLINSFDVSELDMYDEESKPLNKTGSIVEKNAQKVIKIDDDDSVTTVSDRKENIKEDSSTDKETNENNASDEIQQPSDEEKKDITPKEPAKHRANFYKPLTDSSAPVAENIVQECKEARPVHVETQKGTDIKTDYKPETTVSEVSKTSKGVCLIEAELEKMEKPVEIPLLNEPTIPGTPTNSMLSEIDILQALKNEILSESITIPGSETGTPLLHQPKVNKVASAKEMLPKKRISIENYKQKTDREKTVSSIKLYFEDNESKDDLIKKPSLKLTEKECERFNIQKKMSFDDDSSDSDDGGEIQASDLYSDLAPKSPDRDESFNMALSPPAIIPGDSVKAVPVNRSEDVDMRTLPILSPNHNKAATLFSNITGLSLSNTNAVSATKTDQMKSQNRPVLLDPRVRRDVNSSQSPSPRTAHPDRTPRSAFSSINQSPASNAVMTPNARSYEMTHNHQSFDVDQSNKKHVYVPSFTMIDSREGENSVAKDSKKKQSRERKTRFEDIGDTSSWSSSDVSINTHNTDSLIGDKYSKGRNDRYSLENRDCFSYKRLECPRTPLPSFGRSDVPVTSTQTFGRLDQPMTPQHSFGRAECPSTPSHHFGRSECPPTPIHSFGRSDCPSTPSHPFGSHSFNVNERPLTPSHQFGVTECPPKPYYGRNECPATPNHGFGRSDCPSTPNHPFGRSDFNAQNYIKDPRLNRKPEFESNSQLNDRDRGYFKDSDYYRGSSYKSQKPFCGTDIYTSQDREQGRNSKYRYFAPEQTGRQFSKDPPSREQTVGGSMPNDYENDRQFSRERGQYNSGYPEVDLRRGNQRERSIGRSMHPEDKHEKGVGRYNRAEDTRSSSSIRRNCSIEPENKSISVKSHAGSSFRIDTSVNETFQKFLESGKGIQVFEYNFDVRRQRASSVGRSLVQESRCEQVSDGSKPNTETRNKKELFRRASSVGRDLAKSTTEERSFQEIKADFKTYRNPVKGPSKFDTGKIRNIDTKSKTNTENIARSKREKEYYEKYIEEKRVQSASKLSYSPRKNYRDPRMRKENHSKNKYEDPRARKSGIIYSNDNIVKGAILASGYGVKNYKIPKIKRVVEELEVERPKKEEPINKKHEKERKNIEKRKEGTIKEKANDNSKGSKITSKPKSKDTLKERFNESPKHQNKETSKGKPKENTKESDTKSDSETDKFKINIDDMSETDEQIGRRSSRLSRKQAVKNIVNKSKTRKPKKSIISDSDSETDNIVTEKLPIDHETDRTALSGSPVKQKIVPKQPNAIDINTNFGLELEMFTDSVVSDPVLDNINALIADLDNDLDATKNESSNNFTNEITLENMMQNITSPQDNSSESRDDFTKVLKGVDELSKTTDNKMHESSLSNLNEVHGVTSDIVHVNTEISQELKTEDSNSNKSTASVKCSEGVPIQNEQVKNKKNETLNSNLHLSKSTNDDIVSTTDTEKDTVPMENKPKIDERSMDGCSTPDSTINTDAVDKNKSDDFAVDSTNEEVHSETNVTSTDSVEPKPETESVLELGNLLTMLQDKSKIKKLLSMLGDQSGDNNKIKKKLEKLSEIVSDDEIEETTKQPDKNKTEFSVFTDDKNSDANPTVHELATIESELQLHGDKKMKLNENDGETPLNKNVEETQLNKTDETQLNKNDETQLNKNDEKQLIKNDEEMPLNKNDEEPQLNKNFEEIQLNKTDEAAQLNKNNETQLNKNDEETLVNKDDEETLVNKDDKATELNKNNEDTQLNNDEDQENDDDQDRDGSFEDLIGEDAAEAEETDLQLTKTKYKRKMTGKKSKISRKGKGRRPKKATLIAEKRVTRATAAVETKKKTKKPPRELQQLHEDIREMFIRDDILSATGIRMCRLAKMVDDKTVTKDDVVLPEPEPVVLLEKFKSSADKNRDHPIPEKNRKKPGPKPKPKISTDSLPEIAKPKYKPGPKSKTKNKKELDPYAFETESVGDTNIEKASEEESDSSDSEVCSLASSKSYGSTEILSEIKKKKRKRGRWQDGVIKPKNKKKKLEIKAESTLKPPDSNMPTEKQIIVPDQNAYFTDKNYCFRKNELHYSCRLCEYAGSDIVHHYVTEHPHVEIPLSRMAPALAKEAIDQCKEINFNDFSKISSDKYVCIFCYKEFAYNSSVLETFFWHIVSMHTGEYKHTCCECSNENRCPFSLDIPPPPKETEGQLIGYICKKCNFTQLSLENLKNHVIRRHNDEQTAVYTINLSAMSKKTLKDFLRCTLSKPPAIQAIPRVITTRLSEKPSNVAESSELQPSLKVQLASIKSKITFEADDNVGELLDLTSEEPIESKIKIERVESENTDEIMQDEPQSMDTSEISQPAKVDQQTAQQTHIKNQQSSLDSSLEDLASQPSNDIVDYPHFKINFTKSGAKEYICCINGKDNHFTTTLLISMKKHVQLKHSENWDGYCFICKVIVTPQGAHTFKDCFQHYLDKHMDNFPIYQKEVLPESAPEEVSDKQVKQTENSASSKPYLNVRPINELISTSADDTLKETSSFPIIQSVVSLGAESNPTYPTVRQEIKQTEVSFKYEEVQAKVMLNKHRVVLENMMARDILIKVFKCAGRFCSFTSDSAEDALLHASTHQRIGGADALNCSYCDFDALGNAIDLVMHVFKAHGNCQYSCGQCFYRAAASQTVGAHATRVHGVSQSGATVLRTTVATNASDGGRMLTREEAVPYYICHHAESGSKCKFRTYTQDKFCEHLQQKHVGAATHPCYNCQLEVSSPSELVQHMKSHGLKLYQCTWCVLGADNEGELLAHVSTVHPTKQPQAYLRIITNKEGSNELRVLPLAFLNKMKVPTEDVIPRATKENPVREAERSIDLEKLIGLTLMMESQLEVSKPKPEECPQEIIPGAVEQPVAPIAPVAPTVPVADLKAGILSPVSKAVASIAGPSLTDDTNQPSAHTPVASVTDEPLLTITTVPIKTEIETPKSLPGEVVVLDSDDEDARQPVIDLSDEDASASNKQAPRQAVKQKVPLELLSTCPKCQQICKSINGLKKHFFYCYPDKEQGCKCAHCPYMASNRDNIMHHYMHDHCDRNVYQCGVCRSSLENLAMAKRHLKFLHKEKDFVITTTTENGLSCYVLNVAKKEKRELPKRKLSAGAAETLNKRRFWPGEINQLPINPILDHLVYCEICEFSTKVRLNMVRHLQLHAEQQPVAQTAPVNPVPHLETNEKHFDRMVNLASSSLVPRDRPAPAQAPAQLVPRELAARYPQQISARARNTCGAVGCTYTSVDEPMLKRHWEALHSGSASFNFRCVHCPSNQTTDTSKPITANRVVQHLKMHDDTLYACSKCHIYHYKRDYIEKHMMELHQNAPLYIVRESASAAAAAATASVAAPPNAAPTMDLKPWQCGLCKFKSMLRPEVAEHCFKLHQSKMQFRCGYCPYRASALENVNKHLAHSHANEPEDVIYYYYREGSLPDEADGTPRWTKQRQKLGSNLPEVKTEEQETPDQTPTVPPPPVNIDLNLVKKEVDEAVPESAESMGDLCKRFGHFCEPNGIKFKCPLCKVISEDTREAMQSHLYEELKYRKWGCGLCNYKAFHKAGLTEHMSIEHFRQYDHIELPKDADKEKWVAGQLDHQASIIDKHKANLAKQKMTVEKVTKPVAVAAPPTVDVVEKFSKAQLEEAFGEFGAPNNSMYCCPKCGLLSGDEAVMRDHLETELNKIRWGCTNCSIKYQTYHEAQFHCKGHDGPSCPAEAIRDPSMRAAWITNTIKLQKKKILQCVSCKPASSEPPTTGKNFAETDNNSLLVVRYEERVPTPDLVTASRKRPAPDSDDERLVIDEVGPKKKVLRPCPHCPYKSKFFNSWKEHVLKHHNLKPYSCCYCDYNCSYRQGVIGHTEKVHPGKNLVMKMTGIPPAESYILSPKKRLSAEEETNVPKIICLFCENSIPETDVDTHLHENIRPDFARKGDVVVKCCICLVLRLDVKSLQDHHSLAHPHIPVNYAMFKLRHNTRETHFCGHCDDIGFKFLRDLKTHHNAVHPTLLFKYTTVPYVAADGHRESKKKEDLHLLKRCARKSTTKLPGGKTVAKKSTTKLPYSVPSTSDEGYSYYKTKPESLENYADVTTLMSFCNRMMPFTLKKLSEIINIEPKVIVNDIRAGNSSDVTLFK